MRLPAGSAVGNQNSASEASEAETRGLQAPHVGPDVLVVVFDHPMSNTDPIRIERTSVTLNVEVWVPQQGRGPRLKVTAAEFTFVAVNENGGPARWAEQAQRDLAMRVCKALLTNERRLIDRATL